MGFLRSMLVGAAEMLVVGTPKQQDGSVLVVDRHTAESKVVAAGDLEPVRDGAVRVVSIADTHEYHDVVVVPECDLLIVAGDLTFVNKPHDEEEGVQKLRALAAWLAKQPAKDVLLVAGNHDLTYEELGAEKVRSLLPPSVTYCVHEIVTLQGLTIFASPWSEDGMRKYTAFQSSTTAALDAAPRNLDILVTHHAAAASPSLQRVVLEKTPRLHVGGHIHTKYGASLIGSTPCLCANIMTGRYKPVNRPILVDL